jgi:hypothetical protein
MKRSSLKNTVAALLAMGSLGTAPMQQVKAETTTQNEIAGSNKQAVENKETKGQGISTNQMTGGLDFNFPRMFQRPNPIYFPQADHKRAGWANQRRAAQKRKRSK